MENSIIIEGGKRIEGETNVQGSKNAALPLIASCVALGGTRTLKNIPNISDARDLLEILKYFGVKYEFYNGELKINSESLRQISEKEFETVEKLASKIRSSTYLIGAVLFRLKSLRLPKPGGCKLGSRPIDIHLNALKALGCVVKEKENCYEIDYEKFTPESVSFRYPSVGATINVVLFSMFTPKTIFIENTAYEPEVDAVFDFLNKSGRKVERVGSAVKISESEQNRNIVFYNPFDRIVLGDLLLATASTRGEIVINEINPIEIKALIRKITKSPCKLHIKNDKIMYSAMGRLCGRVSTDPFPAFPTDLQAQFAAAALGSGGFCSIKEKVFGNRFEYAKQLSLMGANVRIAGRTLFVRQSELHSAVVTCPDLRGGAGLVIASLATKGVTEIKNLSIIERGYEDVVKMYKKLGASLKRSE